MKSKKNDIVVFLNLIPPFFGLGKVAVVEYPESKNLYFPVRKLSN